MDFSKLRGLIKEKFGTESKFAEAVEMSPRTLSLKLNGVREFRPSEIITILDVLGIPVDSVGLYFFTPKVQ